MRKQGIDRRLVFWLVMALFLGVTMVGVASAQETVIPVATTSAVATADASANEVIQVASDAAEAISGSALSLWAQLTQQPQSDLARIVLIVGGVVLLLAGWLVYEWIILIAGFLIGAVTAISLVNDPNTVLTLIAFLIGGIIGAMLGALLYYIAVFLIGGYVGIAITQAIAVALNLAPVSLVAVIVGFVVGGLVLVFLSMELLIVLAAVVGAQMIVLALGLGVGWLLVLALIGIVIQLVATRSRGISIRRRPRRRFWLRRSAI